MTACRETVTIAEASEILGVCKNTGYKLARQKVIPALRLGRKLVVSRSALDAMLRNPAAKVTRGGKT